MCDFDSGREPPWPSSGSRQKEQGETMEDKLDEGQEKKGEKERSRKRLDGSLDFSVGGTWGPGC